MPEENRVFDVAKPGYGQPQATGKPVIVGHRPAINDPMVREHNDTSPTKIPVMDSQENPGGLDHHDIPVYSPPDLLTDKASPATSEPQTSAPAVFDNQADSETSSDPLAPESKSIEPVHRGGTASTEAAPTEPAAIPPAHVEALQPTHMKKTGSLRWLLALIIIGLIAAYVLLGMGVIKNSLSLPLFKKKATPVVSTPAASQNQPAQASLPTGFSRYNLTGTNITFAAPTSWGTPNSTTDPGYSKRGGSNQSDGAHAYIVNFPNNKDVQIAVTSSKYLPAARDTQYYDYLQWCTGSADGKYYLATLEFATAADKTQTPTTAVCNQGPLSGVTLLDTSTIEQPALKNSGGQALGDLYTKNLADNSSLPVFRVKDAAMTNSAVIKQLLSTVQSTGASAASSSSSH